MNITDKIDDYINERWGTDRTTPKKKLNLRHLMTETCDSTDRTTPKKKQGKWDSWTLDDLKEERMRLKDKETRKPEETTRLRQINFALRSKTGWGKVPT